MAAKIFSKRLRQLRMEKGVSATTMSRALGMADSYIYNIEAAIAYPSMTQFFAICEYLDIAPGAFLQFESETTGKEEELLDAVCGFDNERMDKLIAFAKEMKAQAE
ncbi:MAG: helix-turn-helix transcriptional regulator [Clostridia bacterium]|nr:helix-turn-helix transcriptional regulator [Clostridia bacterium]